MRGNELLDNMELVDGAYVEAADATPKKKTWIRWTAMAASLCLVLGAVFGFGLLNGPGVEPDVEPSVSQNPSGQILAYYSLSHLQDREDYAAIIWGTDISDDDAPLSQDEEDPTGDCEPQPDEIDWVVFNGMNLSSSSYSSLENLNDDDLIVILAVGWKDATLVYEDYVPLNDYLYNGKTYSEIRAGYKDAMTLYDALLLIKEFSDLYDQITTEDYGEEYEIFWMKVFAEVDEEVVLRYVTGTEKQNMQFNTSAISDDLNACATAMEQLGNDMAACRREYREKFNQTPDLSSMMNRDYYVVGNDGVFAVVLTVGQLSQFAQDLAEVYGGQIAENILFRLAARSDLGMEQQPADDVIGEPGISPGGVEETIPDDCITEDIPVDEGE